MASAGMALASKRALGIALERHVVALGDALQEGAVARRALRVQAEVGHRALAQDHDLDVDAADVADHVGVGKEVERRRARAPRSRPRRGRRRGCPSADPCRSRSARARRCDRSRRRGSAGTAPCASSIGLPLRRRIAGEQQLDRAGDSTTAFAVVLPKSQPTSTVSSPPRRATPSRTGSAATRQIALGVAILLEEMREFLRACDQALLAFLRLLLVLAARRSTSAAFRCLDRSPAPAHRPCRSRRSQGRRSRAPRREPG